MIDTKYDSVLVAGIENFEKKIEDYASWIINGGLRFQSGWALAIQCPITCPEAARACAKIAYEQGARDVSVFWTDPFSNLEKFCHSKDEELDNEGLWPEIVRKRYDDKDIAYVIFKCENPEFLNPAGQERQLKFGQIVNANYASFKAGLRFPYVITSASNREWAKLVYPQLTDDEAYIKLWENLFEIAGVDGKTDPVSKWIEHCENTLSYAEKLNKIQFKTMRFTSGLGTDCVFELPKNHIWKGPAETTCKGLWFSANQPAIEIFCIPKKDGVNGKIVSDKSMVTKGGLIESPSLTIKDGKVIDFDAKSGKELLGAILDSDHNGRYLGEIAIVPDDSVISQQNITYYNILFDENSGCHTAIGSAYAKCVEGGMDMNDEELEKAGINVACFHEDCVFGTADTKIVGTTYDGEEITIFENGTYTI